MLMVNFFKKSVALNCLRNLVIPAQAGIYFYLLMMCIILFALTLNTSFAQPVTNTAPTPNAITTQQAPPPLPSSNIQPPPLTGASLPPPPPSSGQQAPNPMAFQTWLKQNGEAPTTPPPAINTSIPNPPGAAKPTLKYSAPPPSSNAIVVYEDQNPAEEESPVVISPPMSYKKSQQLMLKTAPSTEKPSQDAVDAFNLMIQQKTPLTPQQVVKLRQLIDQSQRAASIPATVPPKPVSSTLMINLSPGATPPAIRLAQGYVTSLVFVDSTGTPWPLASYDIGNPKTANIQWDQKSNILLLQAQAPYGDSDLVVRMVGLPTPITLSLVLGQRVLDYRTDIHIPGIGPNTKELPVGTGLPDSANQFLLDVLDGVAPPGSQILFVRNGEGQAWVMGDTMFLRTRLTLLSPGWVGRMVSPDGMHAYEIPRSSSVLVSQYGQPVELKIEGL